MIRVAPVNLTFNPKTLWFDAGDLNIQKGDGVIVSTARGTEFGIAAGDVFEPKEELISSLKSPLRPIRRVATPEDEDRVRDFERKSMEALPIFRELAAETNEDMHPVSVEYLFDGDKAIFYFEADERVDFRDLVRKLASRFHVRIDMRQIGARDEARIIGGLGHCGQILCCKRMGGEFNPVSIRMAKEQDLSLNPQKISGLCGRLMCCLRYEYDTYKEFKSRAPKLGAIVETPDGPATVVELDVPREEVSLRIEEEKPVKVPLADMETTRESGRPDRVGREAWEEAQVEAGMIKGDPFTFLTTHFMKSDKLAQGGVVRRAPGGKTEGSEMAEEGQDHSKRTRRRRGKRGEEASARENMGRSSRSTKAAGKSTDVSGSRRTGQAETPKRTSRRRTTVIKAEGASTSSAFREDSQHSAKHRKSENRLAYKAENTVVDETRKPRRRSTTVSTGDSSATKAAGTKAANGVAMKGAEKKARGAKVSGTKDMRETSKSKTGAAASAKSGESSTKQVASAQGTRAKRKPAANVKPAVRPGQKSSGLRQAALSPQSPLSVADDSAGTEPVVNDVMADQQKPGKRKPGSRKRQGDK